MPAHPDPGPEDERAFLAGYNPHAFAPVAVTVDLVIATIRQGRLCVLLIRRGIHPHRGQWALPGGFVGADETLDAAARRELTEETGLDAGSHLEQLASYGDPDRDPRMRVISVTYLALVADLPHPSAGTDAADARFWPITDLTATGQPRLAFDHDRILVDAIDRIRAKLEYTSLATTFLDEPFTIADLRRVYEIIWGRDLHPANFRRKILTTAGFVVPTGEKRPTGRGWADLYTRGAATGSTHRSCNHHPCESAIAGWQSPAARGIARDTADEPEFVQVIAGEHGLPALVLASVRESEAGVPTQLVAEVGDAEGSR